MGVSAQEAAYVGDIYSVDYLGATAVGMKAFRNGRRRRVPGPRCGADHYLQQLLGLLEYNYARLAAIGPIGRCLTN